MEEIKAGNLDMKSFKIKNNSIDVYLEMDSINLILFEEFIKNIIFKIKI